MVLQIIVVFTLERELGGTRLAVSDRSSYVTGIFIC